MNTINDSYIQEQIDKHKCPYSFNYCWMHTTCVEGHERERLCLKCWLAWCKENNIEIIYDWAIDKKYR